MNGAVDPFLQNYNRSDLETASEFLSNWLPFLTKGLCNHCSSLISNRVRSLNPREYDTQESNPSDSKDDKEDTNSLGSWKDGANGIENYGNERLLSPEYVKSPRPRMSWDSKDEGDRNSLGSWKDGANGIGNYGNERVLSPEYVKTPMPRMSWADMAQEEMEEEADEDEEDDRLQFSSTSSSQVEEISVVKATRKPQLSREERERRRFNNVVRKKDFICLERVNGKIVNILDGLELHLDVFSVMEQKRIVEFVYLLQEKGENRELKERTFTAPQKWMRGKGRVTIQFGCCYNYATDKRGNPPGILRNELVDPIPHLFKVMIKRLVAWHVLPPTCVPDSCIVNIYDEGDCIPPHIDNHDFVRPFCTVSFLSECNILFGTNLKIEGPGEFSGAFKIPLPVGSVLVLNGNGADVAKHCVPAVPTKRISITFRKMDESKWPARFVPEPDLQGLVPLADDSVKPKPVVRGEAGLLGSQPRFYSQSQPVRREETRDNSRRVLGSQPRFYSQSQTRQQGPSSYHPRRTRLEY